MSYSQRIVIYIIYSVARSKVPLAEKNYLYTHTPTAAPVANWRIHRGWIIACRILVVIGNRQPLMDNVLLLLCITGNRYLLLCLPTPHDCLAMLGLRMIALPADFKASIALNPQRGGEGAPASVRRLVSCVSRRLFSPSLPPNFSTCFSPRLRRRLWIDGLSCPSLWGGVIYAN